MLLVPSDGNDSVNLVNNTQVWLVRVDWTLIMFSMRNDCGTVTETLNVTNEGKGARARERREWDLGVAHAAPSCWREQVNA